MESAIYSPSTTQDAVPLGPGRSAGPGPSASSCARLSRLRGSLCGRTHALRPTRTRSRAEKPGKSWWQKSAGGGAGERQGERLEGDVTQFAVRGGKASHVRASFRAQWLRRLGVWEVQLRGARKHGRRTAPGRVGQAGARARGRESSLKAAGPRARAAGLRGSPAPPEEPHGSPCRRRAPVQGFTRQSRRTVPAAASLPPLLSPP